MNHAQALQAFVEVSDYQDVRQAIDALKEMQAAITKLIDQHKATTKRENAPSKAAYVKLHGQAAFDANKTVSDVRTFTWIK
jgi:hypothetical protein